MRLISYKDHPTMHEIVSDRSSRLKKNGTDRWVFSMRLIVGSKKARASNRNNTTIQSIIEFHKKWYILIYFVYISWRLDGKFKTSLQIRSLQVCCVVYVLPAQCSNPGLNDFVDILLCAEGCSARVCTLRRFGLTTLWMLILLGRHIHSFQYNQLKLYKVIKT